jgi:hypothetical protein
MYYDLKEITIQNECVGVICCAAGACNDTNGIIGH